jgi:uncharacterized membrane protein YozB (DUF420 family)
MIDDPAYNVVRFLQVLLAGVGVLLLAGLAAVYRRSPVPLHRNLKVTATFTFSLLFYLILQVIF